MKKLEWVTGLPVVLSLDEMDRLTITVDLSEADDLDDSSTLWVDDEEVEEFDSSDIERIKDALLRTNYSISVKVKS